MHERLAWSPAESGSSLYEGRKLIGMQVFDKWLNKLPEHVGNTKKEMLLQSFQQYSSSAMRDSMETAVFAKK